MTKNPPKSSTYDHVESGKWTTCTKTFDLACCDCSLVHRIDWRLKDGKLQLRFKRNGPSTGGLRKAMATQKRKK